MAAAINKILDRGNTAEVKRRKEDVIVREIKAEIAYKEPLRQKTDNYFLGYKIDKNLLNNLVEYGYKPEIILKFPSEKICLLSTEEKEIMSRIIDYFNK